MTFGMNYPTPEEEKLLHRRELKMNFDMKDMGYSPWSSAVLDPPLPEPYETWEDTKPFFEFAD